LPRDLPAAVFIVQHVDSQTPSVLPYLLQQNGQLEVTPAVDGEEIRKSHIYVAPPDQHLIVEVSHPGVNAWARENPLMNLSNQSPSQITIRFREL
jgi:two-component system chemotaxis response regulator CheB